MTLEVNLIRDQEEEVAKVGELISDRRLWLTKDRQTVVEDGKAEAAFLLCPEGGAIPAVDAERLGLTLKAGKITQKKMQAESANKMAEAPKSKKK